MTPKTRIIVKYRKAKIMLPKAFYSSRVWVFSFNVQRFLSLLIVLVFYMGLGITESAGEGLPKMTQEEVMRIQRYFSVGQEKQILMEEDKQRLNSLVKKIPQGERKQTESEQFAEEYDKLQKILKSQQIKLYAKYGITEEEYNKIQAEISANPGMLMGYVTSGGKIPESDNGEKVGPPLTSKERLEKEGVSLDTLNATTIQKALNNPRVRLDVISVLGEKQDPMVLPYLLEQLNSKELLMRLASAGALCRHKQFEGVPLLLEALTDTSQHFVFRISAIESAGLCQEKPEIVNTMLKILETEPNGSLRMHTAIQIDQRGDPSLMDALIKIRTTEKDVMVRHLLDQTIGTWERKKRIQELGGTDQDVKMKGSGMPY